MFYSGLKLAEQAKRMNNGSKLDFLDGDDLGSLTSSYSSINGSTFSRYDEAKPVRLKHTFLYYIYHKCLYKKRKFKIQI